jgi:hypothetical protein
MFWAQRDGRKEFNGVPWDSFEMEILLDHR